MTQSRLLSIPPWSPHPPVHSHVSMSPLLTRLSLSLSHTHTHSHTHTQWAQGLTQMLKLLSIFHSWMGRKTHVSKRSCWNSTKNTGIAESLLIESEHHLKASSQEIQRQEMRDGMGHRTTCSEFPRRFWWAAREGNLLILSLEVPFFLNLSTSLLVGCARSL